MAWPLKHRILDYIIIFFYGLAFLIIYLIEIEQLVITDPSNFKYPAWPPGSIVDLTHWWGENYHEGLWLRPAWYKATIWVDIFFSGPVYLAGIYAFARKMTWIKYPAIIQALVLIVIVIISMFEEAFGTYSVQAKIVAVLSMVPWLMVPIIVIGRTIRIKD